MRCFLVNLGLCGALIITMTAAKAAAHEPKKTPPSDLTEAELPELPDAPQPVSSAWGILRVTADPESGLANPGLVEQLLQSGEVMAEAIAVVSPEAAKSPKPMRPTIEIITDTYDPQTRVSGGEKLPAGVYMADLQVSSFDERLPAKRLIEMLAKGLQGALITLGNKERYELLHDLTRQSEKLNAELVRERKDIENLRKSLGLLPSEIWRDARLRATISDETLSEELEGLQARSAALEAQIAELGKRIEAGAKADPVLGELQQIVKLREDLVNVLRAKVQADAAQQDAMLNAEAELAETRAEVAKYRRAAAQAAGGERLAELERRLQDTAIEMAESVHKRQFARERTSEKETAELAQRIIRVEIMEEQYRELLREINRLKLQMESRRTLVTLLQSS